jgi:hypothetical protein
LDRLNRLPPGPEVSLGQNFSAFNHQIGADGTTSMPK